MCIRDSDGADHAALKPRLVERRVLAFRLELGGVEHPRGVEVEHDHVRRASLAEGAAGKPQDRGGRARHRFEQDHQWQFAVVNEPQPRRQHGLQADGAVGGLCERQALAFHVLRIVVGHHHVDQARRERRHQCIAVVLSAQRRAHLEEGPVRPDVDFVEGEVVDRGRGGDLLALLLGMRQHRQRLGAGERCGVITAVRERDEAHIALEHDGLGRGRHAGEAEPRRELALVHHAFADDVGILGVVDDERVEIAGVGQRPSHHLGVGHAFCAIGEGDRAGRLEKADLRHLLAAQAFGERGHRLHVHDRGVARAAQHEIDDGGIVDNRRGLGLAHDRGHTPGGRRLARRGNGLAIFRARLAHEGAHVDQAGCDHLAATVDHLGVLRHAGGADATLGFAHDAVGEQDIALDVEVARRIENAPIGEQDRPALGHGRAPPRPVRIPRERCLRIRQIPRQGFEHRHAYRHAHLDLFADQRLGAVGDRGVDLDAAVHGAGMHHQRIGLGIGELLLVEAEIVEVFLRRRHERSVHALALQPQHHHDVRVAQPFAHVAAHLDAEALDAGRQ